VKFIELSSKKEDGGRLHGVLESVPETIAKVASEALLLEERKQRRGIASEGRPGMHE
jgi:hypothetical protein